MSKIELLSILVGKFIFALFKGDPGVGKTLAAASFPKPLKLLDFDERVAPIITYYPELQAGDIEIERFSSHLQITRCLDELAGDTYFNTVVLDSLTFMVKFLLLRISDMKGGDTGKRVGGVKVADLEDYGAEDAFLMQVIDKLRRLRESKHVIVTAHVVQVEEKNIRTGMTTVSRSLLTGGKKIAKIIPGAFDECYHFDVDSTDVERHVCYTHHTGNDWAKTALKIPQKIDFTNGNFYEIWRNLVDQSRVTI